MKNVAHIVINLAYLLRSSPNCNYYVKDKMNVVVTGAAGFLGSRITTVLLSENSPLPVARLLLVDQQRPPACKDPRVSTLAVDLAEPSSVALVVQPDCDVLFHLAAVVSGQAEADLELGLRVNFDAIRALADEARRRSPALRFVFTSTVGVYGGDLPEVIDELTATTPQTSYGSQKAMAEVFLNDYSRRGYLDARIVRLPTVSVRAGTANRAVTSFASGIIREPLSGESSVCPVDPGMKLWLTSPATVARNIVMAGALPVGTLGVWRVLNLPGLCVSVHEMVESLRTVAGDAVAALVSFEYDEIIASMVRSMPSQLDAGRALRLGFHVDKDFAEIIRLFISES